MSKCICLSKFVAKILHDMIFSLIFFIVSIDGQYQFTLGTQESANLNTGFGSGSNPAISYSYGTKIVYVELVCSTDFPGNLEAMGEGQIETFFFRLTSKCACPNGCQSKLF